MGNYERENCQEPLRTPERRGSFRVLPRQKLMPNQRIQMTMTPQPAPVLLNCAGICEAPV